LQLQNLISGAKESGTLAKALNQKHCRKVIRPESTCKNKKDNESFFLKQTDRAARVADPDPHYFKKAGSGSALVKIQKL
jgi:hypothetical protein